MDDNAATAAVPRRRSERRLAGLPAESNAFVGRRREIAEVRRLLSVARLVTLTGVGGGGKSRLAARVAGHTRPAFPRVVWVDLAPLADGSLLEYHVAGAAGVRDLSDRDVSDVLLDYLRERELLLVVDNCEHLLDACARFAARLLPAAGSVRVLCTSRQPLGITGEHVYPVLPLRVPEPDRPMRTAARNPALALFVQRAAAVSPGFALTPANRDAIATVCHRLDGLPLAIELAAARVRTTPVDAIAADLRDRVGPPADRRADPASPAGPAGPRTLEAVFDWSYALCSPDERALWARMSVFAGSFGLDAAEHVCDDDVKVWEPLAGLVDKSVLLRQVEAGEDRYRLLDTVRRYGLERLRAGASAEAPVLRGRHRDWYLALAERFDADWFGPRQPEWTWRMSAELPNLRAALGYCVGADPAAAVRLAGALAFFWFGCGAPHEGRHWLGRALAAADEAGLDPDPGRLRAVAGYCWLLVLQGDRATAGTWARRNLDDADRLGEPLYAARARFDLGSVRLLDGDLPGAREVLESAVTRFRALDTDRDLVMALAALALVALYQRRPAEAVELLAESRDRCRKHGERWWLGHALAVSATVGLSLGLVTEAGGYAREALRLCLDLNDPLGVAGGLERLAWVAAADRDFPRAARLLGAADRRWRGMGRIMYGSPQLLQAHEARVAETREAMGEATYRVLFRRGAALTFDRAVAYALDRPAPP